MRAVRRLIRRFLGLDEDRASLWGGIRSLRADADDIRRGMKSIREAVEQNRILAGRALAGQILARGPLSSLREAEFKVFSQFGDDGIIQYLVRHLEIKPDTFIEFGVTDYTEANTRFLLVNNNWRGLVMDGDPTMIERVRRDSISVFHDITAVAAFIDRDNVNSLFVENGFEGDIGLLSIDIDGNDYWVWEAITAVNPVVVVCEYNSVFGPTAAVTVPYDPKFERARAHPSRLYYGASLAALCLLAERKGYAFVGSNSNGNNAYFVRRDRLGGLRALSASEGYVESRFREAVDNAGHPMLIGGLCRSDLVSSCEVVDLTSERRIPLGTMGRDSAA
jgi:hypothetical protein